MFVVTFQRSPVRILMLMDHVKYCHERECVREVYAMCVVFALFFKGFVGLNWFFVVCLVVHTLKPICR